MIRQYKYEEISGNNLFLRTPMPTNVADTVSDIIRDVRQRGDIAVRKYCRRLDRLMDDTALEVTRAEIDAAYEGLDSELRATLEKAADNIRAFHRNQIRSGFMINERPGVVLG